MSVTAMHILARLFKFLLGPVTLLTVMAEGFSISFGNSARAVNTHAVAVETVVTVVEVFFHK